MNTQDFSEEELIKMLLSNDEAIVTKALLYMYDSPHWQTTVQDAVTCLPAFFEPHYPKLLNAFRDWLAQKGSAAQLSQKGLTATIKKMWREYTAILLEAEDLLPMFRANSDTMSSAMDVCFRRFYDKLKAALMKKKPDEEAVKEVLNITFFNVFERLKRAPTDFSFTSTMEAYFMSSCKHTYWKYWDKKQSPFEDIENNAEFANIEWSEYVDNEQAVCFETKVFPELRAPCQKILGMAKEGYKNPEIAHKHKYTIGYVKRRKSECLSEARALAQKHCGDL